jgi:hypothetical protein
MVPAKLYDALIPNYQKIKDIYLAIREENAFFRKAGFNAWWDDFSSLDERLENDGIQSKLKSKKNETPIHYRIARIISFPETGFSANYSFWNLKALLR